MYLEELNSQLTISLAGNRVYFNSTRTGVIRDYVQSVKAGLLTADPAAYFDKNVCSTLASRLHYLPLTILV